MNTGGYVLLRDIWAIGHEVDLSEMLRGRERRAGRQKAILDLYHRTLICFTLNIAGPIKVSALTKELFLRGYDQIGDALNSYGLPVMYSELSPHSYGYEGYWVVDADSILVKRLMSEIEDGSPIGRLYDIDVLWPDGEKVSRLDTGRQARTCIICGNPASDCASRRLHSVEELQEKTFRLIIDEIRREGIQPRLVGRLCRLAMLHEVYTTPKPGLVDLNNNGSHTDMDVALFEKSAKTVETYFTHAVECGLMWSSLAAKDVLSKLRPLGIQAEKDMFSATGGVNTHKGLIFSLGIICCAIGHIKGRHERLTVDRLLTRSGEIAAPALANDLRDLPPYEEMTAGQREYAEYGISGIRGEAASGFQSVRRIGFPILEQLMDDGESFHDAGRIALLHLIVNVNDTNMIKRCGRSGFRKLQDSIADDLDSSSTVSEEYLLELDRRYIQMNASPGGCADLLAICYFLHMLTELV
jgi:holo-ACP synthase/triphosphoribosyl-dephospho-CoA synthase